ncbi:MAG: Glycosyl transferase family 2 [candidate division WS6 bacterium 34_10]|uniref:Glycosyl transferase family 2 n=1 Tax=candidate division WS6 bacterium 34_10 TaxID=1641389 RepID=A0A101HJB1_9BACT|nr:MAG: Glycosyl transferase family 2 [candidate division WS6 bacterium 34_10]
MSPKKTIAISSVRNEEDIIESFVRYSLEIFDYLVVNENCSLDFTSEILKNLEEEGLNLEIITDNREVFAQEQRTNELLDYVMKRYKPDWVFPLDGDEFLFTKSKEEIECAIDALNPNIINLFGWDTYVITGKEDNTLFIPEKFQYRREDQEVYYKTCISNELYDKGARLALASHDIMAPPDIDLERSISDTLRIAHYPVRSSEQLMNKIIVGILNKISNYPRTSVTNYHQQRIFDDIVKNGYISSLLLQEYSFNYAVENPSGNSHEDVSIVQAPIKLLGIDSSDIKYTKPIDKDRVLSIAIETAAGIIEDLRMQKESLQAVKEENEEIKKSLEQKDKLLSEIKNSKGWKLLERLRDIKRKASF